MTTEANFHRRMLLRVAAALSLPVGVIARAQPIRTVDAFGAKPDGKDSTEKIQQAIDSGEQTVGWVRSDLKDVLARDPHDPSVEEMLGRLALIGSRGAEATDEAILRFTLALQQRPSSPYSWASLAEALYRKGDTGAAFENALVRAAQTGPWEPEVQLAVADYGLAVWGEVKPLTRVSIERLVANGMHRNAAEILQISERRGRLGVACAHLGDTSKRTDPKWTQLCQSPGAT